MQRVEFLRQQSSPFAMLSRLSCRMEREGGGIFWVIAVKQINDTAIFKHQGIFVFFG